jgi:hypothetical protein
MAEMDGESESGRGVGEQRATNKKSMKNYLPLLPFYEFSLSCNSRFSSLSTIN